MVRRGRASVGRMGLWGVAAMLVTTPAACGPRRWAVVNVTDQEATVVQDRGLRRDGGVVHFTSAVLEHQPHPMAGQLVDYWTQQTTVDCRARTYQLGDVAAFRADGGQLATDAGTDPAKALRPGSIEATEADDVCARSTTLPRAADDNLAGLLHDFRTGSVLPGVHPGSAASS